MNDSTKPHYSNYQAEKQQVANRKGKQLVLVSNLVLIALQFGPYCKPKQVVLLFRLVLAYFQLDTFLVSARQLQLRETHPSPPEGRGYHVLLSFCQK